MKITTFVYLLFFLASLQSLSQITQYRFKVEYPTLDSLNKNSKNRERHEQKKIKVLPKFIDIFQYQNNFIQTMWGYNGLYLNNKVFSKNDNSIFFVSRSNIMRKDTSSYYSSDYMTFSKLTSNQYLIEEDGALDVIIHLKDTINLPDSIKVIKHLNNYPEFTALRYFNSIEKIQISSGLILMTLIPFEENNVSSDSLVFQEFFNNLDSEKIRDDFFSFIERTKSELKPFEIDGVLHRINSLDTIPVLDQPAQCDCNISSYIYLNIKYPRTARRNKTKGTVIVSFVVRPDGTLDSIEIIQSVSKEIDEAVLKVIKNMPRWTPASYRNNVFSTRLTLPIMLNLE